MLVEAVTATSSNPTQLVIFCTGAGGKYPSRDAFPDSLLVVFSGGRGYGLTGYLQDNAVDGYKPQAWDESDLYVRQFCELYQSELRAANVFHSLQDNSCDAGNRYRVLLPPANFRPADAHLVDMVRDRLLLLRRWFPRVFPAIKRTLLIGESAGTHTLVILRAVLASIAWACDRVVMSAYAMPKSLMRQVLKTFSLTTRANPQ
mgnify:CR=1 FL=1